MAGETTTTDTTAAAAVSTPAPQQTHHTVDEAVDAYMSRQPTVDRAPNGQFTSQQKPPADVVDIKTAKPVDPAIGHNGGPELEEDFFEFEPEKDGEQPRRVKVDEVLAAYEELPTLKKELETIRTRSTAAAPEVIKTVQENMHHRQQLIAAYDDVMALVKPKQPDPRQYASDPEGFREAMERFQNHSEYVASVKAEREKQMRAMAEENSVLTRAAQAKAEQEIYSFWPEMQKAESRNAAFKEIEDLYGIPREQLIGVPDATVWRVVKDAVAFKRSQAKQAEAVKVARAKPKLVRGNARQATTGAGRQSAMDRFAKSDRSVDAAVEALFGQ